MLQFRSPLKRKTNNSKRLHPGNFPRSLDLPFCMKVNFGPSINLPPPFKPPFFLSSFPINHFLPTHAQSIIRHTHPFTTFRICKTLRLTKDDLEAFVFASRNDIAYDKVVDGEVVFIVDRYFGGVRRGVGDFGEGTSIGFNCLGGAFIGHFGGCVVSEGTLKVVASVDVLL